MLKLPENLLTGLTVTFEAAESTDEEEAELVLVNIIQEFKLRGRTRGASGLQRGGSLPRHHSGGHALTRMFHCNFKIDK